MRRACSALNYDKLLAKLRNSEGERSIRDQQNALTMHKADNDILQQMVLDFVSAYGFLGFMTALPTTVQFVTYESVYLPKNHFIKEETLSTEDYLTYFYPFEKLDFHKKGTESGWSVADKDEIAVVMAMGNRCAFLLC